MIYWLYIMLFLIEFCFFFYDDYGCDGIVGLRISLIWVINNFI